MIGLLALGLNIACHFFVIAALMWGCTMLVDCAVGRWFKWLNAARDRI